MKIPPEILTILSKLQKKGFEAFLVGGCVRDLILKKSPADWDVATNANPEEIQAVFPESFTDNKFGTVAVKTGSTDANLAHVEVTPYRAEEEYRDKRHPEKVRWVKTIEEDLARRDFTINAMALAVASKQELTIKDPYQGQKDLKKKIIRAVGNATERFGEDALRMMRAVRFAAVLNFALDPETATAIEKNADSLKEISKERIREELVKIISSDKAAPGIEMLRALKLLKHVIPELEEGYKVGQNKHHIYDCWEHYLRSLDFAARKGFSWQVRLASLLHDVGKPRCKRGEGINSTFYNHEVVGTTMTKKIMERLHFPTKDTEHVAKLVRYHLFYYNVDEVSESSVRRLVRNVGPESMEDLLRLRMADRIGSGVPKAEPYKLRHLKYVIDKVSHDPISAKMLKIDGSKVMKLGNIKPGPRVGQILDILLGYILKDPKKNTKEFLEKEAKKLATLTDTELVNLAQGARQEREGTETKIDQMTKQKYWVT